MRLGEYMGSFNPQYEKYYKSLKSSPSINNKIRRNNGLNYIIKGNYLVKRIIKDLIGVTFLLAFVLICKIIVIPQTQTVYNYSKKMVNTNFDYKAVMDEVKKIDFSAVRIKAADFLEKMKIDNSLNWGNLVFKVNKYFVFYILLLVVVGYKGKLFLAFIIALFHEGVHYLTAKRLGFKGLQIEFFPLGTVLLMKDLEEASPYEDLIVSISGPLSNILISILFMILNYKFRRETLNMLIYGNLSIGLFNLIPALPLDGGRILRNLLNFKTFYKRANRITVNISIILGIGMMFSYLVLFIKGKNSFSIGLVALFVIVTALKEKERVAYIIMGDVIKKKYKFVKKGYIENRSISIYYKMDLINLMNFIDKNKYNIFMIMDENMKLIDILYEEDIIEALKIYGNIKIEEYLKLDFNSEKTK